ncbi:aldose epimerase family protein [Sphingomonas sp. CARO-RG-8B-R24-01]|uniref:aldose epimerase family protein n=1 Tax=Sphingomonas sp. CARO-RG-8B-R24-01 TaxID=2914831 RepID=UPI001F56D60E|nr:aldose epimerase family protein [Sphingomonas sp. CARO-RG-8B-R24-01]
MFKAIAIMTLSVGVLAAVAPSVAQAASADRTRFGTLADGETVEAVTLTNAHGMRARILSYGAILQAVEVPDRDGRVADVTLGYADMRGYLAAPNYFGATVGRYANRIKGGRFSIDGRSYSLALNDKTNALHGGVKGFDKRLWRIVEAAGGAKAHVTLAYTSADGEEGYPGELRVTATYTLNDANELSVEYRATTTKPTIVNITNHSFFNLGGEAAQRSIYDAVLTIPADMTTPVDATLIPTGQLRPVAGTPFDFRQPTVIGSRIRDASDPQIVFGQGYDENFVIARDVSKTPRLAARVEDPMTGRTMEVLSNHPGVQLYTGNFLDGTAVGKSGHAYRQGDGLALEPQVFPDTPNQPALGSARLDPGQTYRNVIVYRFSVSAR